MQRANQVGSEAAIREIWQDVLRLDVIDSQADFFDIGGDSMKAMEVILNVSRLLQVELPLMSFFEDPTVAHLSAVVDGMLSKAKSPGEAITEIWKSVLRLPEINVDADFFDLGGDSMKAMEVIARISDELGAELPLMSFFEDPTILHLAEVVAELTGETPVPTITRVAGRTEFPLSYSQEVFWLLEQQNAGTGVYNTARVFLLHGKIDPELLERSLNELRRRHEILRVRFLSGVDGPLQIVDAGAALVLAISDISSLDSVTRERTRKRLAIETILEPFDLASGPPLRARLIRESAEESLLCISIHHVVSDGFTGSILLEELSIIYDAFDAGRASPLPEVEIHFTDYAAWERQTVTGGRLDEDLAYWNETLAGVPTAVDLPIDYDRPAVTDRRGYLRSVTLPKSALTELQALAQASSATLFTVLSASFRILLNRWTGQSDFLVGTIASNRSRSRTERMVGCFVNPLALRNAIGENATVWDVVSREKVAVMNAFAHQDCPFTKIVERVNPERTGNDNPLFNVAFLLQSYPAISVTGRCFSADDANFDAEVGLIDLRFIAFESGQGLQIDCEYRSAVFDMGTIDQLLLAFTDVVSQVVRSPQLKVAEIKLPQYLIERSRRHQTSKHKQTITISANFTAEPLQEVLSFWMSKLNLPSRIEFAPFDQVYQQLLDPASALATNKDGVNVVLFRWREDDRKGAQAKELAEAITGCMSRTSVPMLLCLSEPDRTDEDDLLIVALAKSTGVNIVTFSQVMQRYGVEAYQDRYAEEIGSIPYTPEFYTAVASMLARRIYALRATPCKVIALDCDNTLWKGVCGEDGPMGVEVDAPRRALQEFMLAQREAGVLLCLCSKNVEADVTAVFAQNPGMILRAEHFVASRVNWKAKSGNLKDLALLLKLDLESFVLVDDNPVECAEVRAHCPSATVLELPQNPQLIPSVLQHMWTFDHWSSTMEDRSRSVLYQQEQNREDNRGAAASLTDFLDGLELQIDIHPMRDEELPRVSQLTQRTNQFNCTTIRRSEADIVAMLQEGMECLTVHVKDRFGDYGLIAMVLFESRRNVLAVDSFLMSCRALGRRIEHHIVNRLGEVALARKLASVDLYCTPTARNAPAKEFLDAVAGEFRNDAATGYIYRLSPAYASRALEITSQPAAPVGDPLPSDRLEQTVSIQVPRVNLEEIARTLGSVPEIDNQIRAKAARLPARAMTSNTETATEEMLAGIWATVLHAEAPGPEDNFFHTGGNSLLAVQVISRVRQAFGMEMPLRAMFEDPTVRGFALRIDAARRAKTGSMMPALTPTDHTSPIAASFAQQRLWFLDQLEPGNPIYNIPQRMQMAGTLNVEALRHSFAQVIRRHKSLRTRFEAIDGQPFQNVEAHSDFSLPFVDLIPFPVETREVEIERLSMEEARRPFDLTKGLLLRARLLRTNVDRHVLLIVLHHISADRWSAGILANELETLYECYAQGRTSPLAELPVQYLDFSEWQRGWLRDATLQKQAEYWRTQLAGVPAFLDLSIDHPRPALLTYKGSTETTLIPDELLERLTALSQIEGVTLFMTLLAALQVLFGRYSGQEDFVIGSPIAGRNVTEVESLIGFFVNTLALRADLSGNPSFRALLKRVKETTLGAYAHQDIPFERLVEELQPERSLSRQPIFQVVFALQNAPQRSVELSGLQVTRMPLHQGTSAFDLSWFATPMQEGMQIRVEYSTDLFKASTVQRAVQHFVRLLNSIACEPGKSILELSLLPPEEAKQVALASSGPHIDFPRDRPLQQYFEDQVIRTPDAAALWFKSQMLTYAELNTRANRLAHRLRTLGVGPDILVGICADRSLEMVVGLLGILKAGGAYLPLDPEYPGERLRMMLTEADPPVLLTMQHLVGLLQEDGLPTICLDQEWETFDPKSETNPDVLTKGTNLAYVIYTSGSTGKPKGVANVHEAILNRLLWMQSAFPLQADDRVLQKTPFSFDVSVWEFFWPLMTGAALVIAEPGGHKDPRYLAALIETRQITTAHFVPSMLRAFIESDTASQCKSLRRVICSGEALPRDLQERFFDVCNAELHNLYGPTEAAVDVTWWTCRQDSLRPTVPIGQAIWNTQIRILDPQLNEVPFGVPGELHIGGVQLARGYLKRPDLTSEKFIQDPFSDIPGARLYKSGDRARMLSDGVVEYLGRIDHQVKIRGFRIEPGEIENALRKHATVKDCVVVAREDVPGDRRLVAYVVPHLPSMEEVAELQTFLSASLPDFMVPQSFVSLDVLPLSANGKVDRNALPSPHAPVSTSAYVPPSTVTERGLKEIWTRILHAEHISVRDNFFKLGGHSLLATQVLSRIRTAMGVDLPLRAMFECPTLEALAKRIDGTARSGDVEHIPKVPRDRPLPLSFAQERLWFLDQFEPGNPQYNAPLPMRLKGPLNTDAIQAALNSIVARHEVLRTTFRTEHDRPVQEIAPELRVSVPVIDLTHLELEEREPEARRLAIEEARRPFNLRNGPVLRASILRLDEEDHVVLLDIHHIATDGWSIWPFIQELGAFYEAHLANTAPCLPDLPIQYADFAVWQRRRIESEQISSQLAYWKEQLLGAPDRIDLPSDRPRPAVQSYRGATETVYFPAALLRALHLLGQSEGATLYMTLLAAFQTLLHRYTGENHIVVGSPIANRTRSETEDLIGFFVNTLVMHTDVSGNPSFRELIRRVRAVALGAFAHQDLPFEKLVEAIAPDRDLSSNPLVQLLFVMQNARRSVLKIAGVQFAGMPIHNGSSKFDLGIFFLETDEELSCVAEYATDLFDSATIRRMLKHFGVLLAGVIADAEARLSELPIMDPGERRLVTEDFNATSSPYPHDLCVHDLVQRQAVRTPMAVAVVDGERRLTYMELNRRANQLAHLLLLRGAGPDVLIGVCGDRTAELLVAILAILKAGSAYVPLDPNYPADRLANILEDSGARLVLTLGTAKGAVPAFAGEVVHLDAQWTAIHQEPEWEPTIAVTQQNLAYVLFTSGSTGRPKGVALEHRSAIAFIFWAKTIFSVEELAGVLFSTSVCFDLSIFELFVTLSSGGKVILAENALYLPALPARDEVTLINTVPSAIAELVRVSGVPDTVSVVNLAGEALPSEVVERIYASTKVAKVYNLYGPTEDTTYSTFTLVPRGHAVTIGRPIANTRCYVLDSSLGPVPVGVPGELYIAGDGLAREYYGRPELTAERFVRDPFGAGPNARMYRTGDRCRWCHNGELQYLGRLDHQVKLRGFRIELGEIETTLDKHPGVDRSVVMVREDEPGLQRLVAYFVGNPGYKGADSARTDDDAISALQVAQWAATFDEAYQKGATSADATFNLAGWNSSYTGEPIPSEQMRVWVQTTVDRILALRPRSVLEIGCGTGLLLFQVAPHCARYVGTDISGAAIAFLEHQLSRQSADLPGVSVQHRGAHELGELEEQFDVVVINSVAQYFPDLAYLQQVLEAAVKAAGPEGSVFVGDLRSYPMLALFHTSVQLHQATDTINVGELARRVDKNIAQESELLIDPEFFQSFRDRLPGIKHIEVELKRGRDHNELARFRFDVILHLGKLSAKVDCPWIHWQRQEFSLALLRETLETTRPDILGLTAVPNARLRYDSVAQEQLSLASPSSTVAELRSRVDEILAGHEGVEPEDFWSFEAEAPYRVEIRASRTPNDGCIDVILRRIGTDLEALHAEPYFPGERVMQQPLRRYSNNPLRQRVTAQLVPQLRVWLDAQLPAYMVPQAFVLLDVLPLSANGKVDRKSLPPPDQSRGDLGGYAAPNSPTEEMLAAIVGDVLRLERVSVTENFFELGGHSLSATQVVARVRSQFDVDLSVRALFEAPTVLQLAQTIEGLERGRHQISTPPLVRAERGNSIPLSYAQQRLWFFCQMDPLSPLYNMPWAVRLIGAVDPRLLEIALCDLLRRHEILRTVYAIEDDLPIQKVLSAPQIPLTIRDLSGLSQEDREWEARHIVQQERARPFDLSFEIPFRPMLIKLHEFSFVLFVGSHHIACDGWSLSVMASDLAAFYEIASSSGTHSANLPVALPVQYADFALWQRGWLEGKVLEQQLSYWRGQLQGAPPVLTLPTDKPRPAIQTFRGATVRVHLTRAVVDQIGLLSRQQGVSSFMTMLAAFQCVILHATGQRDMVLGTDLAGRTNVETEALIGFFVNLIPLRTDLSQNPTFAELLARVREVALGAYAHQDMPFDKLVEELKPERSQGHHPLVQILFVHQNTPRNLRSLPNIEMKGFAFDMPSKFDLAVFCADTDVGMTCRWHYNPDLFEAGTITRLAEHLQVVLEAVIREGNLRLSDILSLIDAQEAQRRGQEHTRLQEVGAGRLRGTKRRLGKLDSQPLGT